MVEPYGNVYLPYWFVWAQESEYYHEEDRN